MNILLKQILSTMVPKEDRKRNILIENIAKILSYEGSLDYIRTFLKPRPMHVTGKLPATVSSNILVSFCDVRFILRCNIFNGVFAKLVCYAPPNARCQLVSPHCLFHVTDLYTHMMLCKLLNTTQDLLSFYMQCIDAKKQLSGNRVRHKKRKWEDVTD